MRGLLELLRGFPAEGEPDGAVLAPHHFYVGVLLAVFGFVTVTPYYAPTGWVMVLAGLAIALDDALSHSLGIPTPLDLLWKKVIYPWLPSVRS